MKRLLFFVFLLLSLQSFSQSEKDRTAVDKILEGRPTNFFDLKEKILAVEKVDNEYLIEYANRKDYPLLKIYALNAIATSYPVRDNLNEAINHLNDALKIAEKINSREGRLVILNSLGIYHRKTGNIADAIDYNRKVIELANKIRNHSTGIIKTLAISKTNVGEIYRDLELYDMAINEFKESIELEKKTNNKKGIAINYFCLGQTYKQLGKYDLAIEYYEKSLKNNTGLYLKVGKIRCNNEIASVYILQGKRFKALHLAERNYYGALKLGYEKYLARTHLTLARAQKLSHDFYAAETNFLKAYKLYNKMKKKDKEYAEMCIYISDFYRERKFFEKSLSYYRKGIRIEEQNLHKQNIVYIGNLIKKYDLQTQKMKLEQASYETSRIRNILLIILIILSLLGVSLYSIYHRRVLNNDKKILKLKQESLQSQMNPHFIFNALNSIKLYIINNEKRQAVYYLNKFAKLIRSILDNSKSKEVTLKDELETMDLYMSIENIRFNNEIEYIQKVTDETLNLETIKLPPLVLQPFLENAIWHGLSSKESDKKLFLIVERKTEFFIEIHIKDNGVGRERAMEIKKGKSLKRKSIGVNLTEDRLSRFYDEYLENSYIKFVDLKDIQGNPSGTEVVLGIPLE